MNTYADIRPPCVLDIRAEDYHAGPGISKSGLDWIHQCPALLEWSQKAPVDEEAKSAVQIGTALHTLLLEPARFALEYVADFKAPDGALVTADDIKGALTKADIKFAASASKAALAKLLLDHNPNAPVSDRLHEEWQRGISGRVVVSPAEWRKLHLMRDSVMAHPTARKLFEADGEVERCHYWTDKETGELCRSRPDKTVPSLRVIADVKTAADVSERGFNQSIHEYRYHVQDAFYTDGCTKTMWKPQKFLFVLVGTTRDRARYPVHVRELPPEHVQFGRDEYRMDLHTYAHAKKTGTWNGIERASLPEWSIGQYGGISA